MLYDLRCDYSATALFRNIQQMNVVWLHLTYTNASICQKKGERDGMLSFRRFQFYLFRLNRALHSDFSKNNCLFIQWMNVLKFNSISCTVFDFIFEILMWKKKEAFVYNLPPGAFVYVVTQCKNPRKLYKLHIKMTDQLTESVDSMSLETGSLDYQQMISLELFKDEQIS